MTLYISKALAPQWEGTHVKTRKCGYFYLISNQEKKKFLIKTMKQIIIIFFKVSYFPIMSYHKEKQKKEIEFQVIV